MWRQDEIKNFLITKGAKLMNEWISVKERLPEKDGVYLCCIQNPFSDSIEWWMHIYITFPMIVKKSTNTSWLV